MTTVRYALMGCAIIAVAMSGCGPRRDAGGQQAAAPKEPVTLGVLKLMPESASTAVAFPSVERAYDQLEAFLLRASPKDINMEAELKVVLAQIARLLDAYDATTATDIALAKGVDPAKPLGLFLGAGAAAPTSEPVESMELFRMIGVADLPPFALVLPYADRQDAEKTIAEWCGQKPMDATDLDVPATTLFAAADGSFAYFFTDAHVVAGTSAELVKGVAERMKNPASVRYGTAECPADDPYEIVQLVRADKIADAANTVRSVLSNTDARTRRIAGDAWEGWLDGYTGSDPLVLTYWIKEEVATARLRIDYSKHPEAQARLAPPDRLTHLDVLPKSTVAAYSFVLPPKTKEALKEIVREETGATEGLLAQINNALGQIIDATGGKASVAVLEPGPLTQHLAVLVDFQDGEAARALIKELGFAPIVAETYNDIEIYSFVMPPASVFYALPKSTFVLAANMGAVKGLIDAVNAGKSSGFASTLQPPIETETPREQVLVIKREALDQAFEPLLESSNLVPTTPDNGPAVANFDEKLREIRLTTDIVNNWHDTRLTVQLQ